MTSSQAQDATGTGVTSTGAIPLFPISPEAGCPFDPPRHLREAAGQWPVSRVRIWNDGTPWIITGHAEQRVLLSDPRVSVNDRLPGFPHWHAGMEQVSTRRAPSVFNTDPPEHTRFRRMMTAPFTFKRVNAMRAVVQEITDDLIDQMLACQPTDLVEAIALPLPTRMICAIMGVPYEDHADVLGAGRDRDEEGRHRVGPDGVLQVAARLPRRPGRGPGWPNRATTWSRTWRSG